MVLTCPECGSIDIGDYSEPNSYRCYECNCISTLILVRRPIEIKMESGMVEDVKVDYHRGSCFLKVNKEAGYEDECIATMNGYMSDSNLNQLSRLRGRIVEIIMREVV